MEYTLHVGVQRATNTDIFSKRIKPMKSTYVDLLAHII